MEAQILPNTDEYHFGYLSEYEQSHNSSNDSNIRKGHPNFIPYLPPDLAESVESATLQNYIGSITQENCFTEDHQATKEVILYSCLNAHNYYIRLMAQEKLAALYQSAPGKHRGLAHLLYKVHIESNIEAIEQLANAYRFANLGIHHNLEAAVQVLNHEAITTSPSLSGLKSKLDLFLFKINSANPLDDIDDQLENDPVNTQELLFHIARSIYVPEQTQLKASQKLAKYKSPCTLQALQGLLYNESADESIRMQAIDLLESIHEEAALNAYTKLTTEQSLSESTRLEALRKVTEKSPLLALDCCINLLKSETISTEIKLVVAELFTQMDEYSQEHVEAASEALVTISKDPHSNENTRVSAAYWYSYINYTSDCSSTLFKYLLRESNISSTAAIRISKNYIYTTGSEADKDEADICLQARAFDQYLNEDIRIDLACAIASHDSRASCNTLSILIQDSSMSIDGRKNAALYYLDINLNKGIEYLENLTQTSITPDTIEQTRQLHEISSYALVQHYNNRLNAPVEIYAESDSNDEEEADNNEFLLNQTAHYLTILSATNIEEDPINNPYFQYTVLTEKAGQVLETNTPQVPLGQHTVAFNFARFNTDSSLPEIQTQYTHDDWILLIKSIFTEAAANNKQDVLKAMLTTYVPEIADENDEYDGISGINNLFGEHQELTLVPQQLSEEGLLSIANSSYFQNLFSIPNDASPPNRYALILQNLIHIALNPTEQTKIKDGILSHQSQIILQTLLNVIFCPTGKEDGLLQMEPLALGKTYFIPEDEKSYWNALKSKEENIIREKQSTFELSADKASQAYTNLQTKYRLIEEALIAVEALLKKCIHKLIHSQSDFLKTLTGTPLDEQIRERQHSSRWIRYLIGNELGLLLDNEIPSFDRSTNIIPSKLFKLDKPEVLFILSEHLFQMLKESINKSIHNNQEEDHLFTQISALLNYQATYFDEILIDEKKLLYQYNLNDLGLLEILHLGRWIERLD